MTSFPWLVLRLEAPLLAFGGVTIDNFGVTRDFPAASMLTGLLANALGYRRSEWERHQELQDRLIFACRRDDSGRYGVLSDTQNAHLSKSDIGWTTGGQPEGRDGASYGGPHRRFRDYLPDACATVVLRLAPADLQPDLESIADALDRPARPLFIGRKPCLPTGPLRQGNFVAAPDAHAALLLVPARAGALPDLHARWPRGNGPDGGEAVDRIIDLADLRNWRTGLHGGSRRVVEGRVTPERAVE